MSLGRYRKQFNRLNAGSIRDRIERPGGRSGRHQPVHLQDVVRQADQRPFALRFSQPVQQKLADPARLFDLSEDLWFAKTS